MIKVDGDMVGKQKNRFILGLFFLAVFFLRVFYISKVKGPFVYADEMGYWGHAANLTGNTWAGVMDGMPWYAFGYSLLLAPLFLLTADMVIMYRTAVLVNAVLGIFSFVLAYKIIQKLRADDGGVLEKAVLAFTATSFTSYIFHSYIAWSETLFSFLAWLILYEIILLEESPRYWKVVLLGATVGYGYMVHSRMMAVIAAVLSTLLVMLWNKKIKMRHLLGTVGVIAAAVIVCFVMQGFFCGLLEGNILMQEAGIGTGFSQANTLSDQIAKLGQIFTAEGFKKFIVGTAGQFWQMLSSTYFLAGVGIVFCIKQMYRAVKNNGHIGGYVFPVASVIFTVPMTSLFFINYRYDIGNGSVRIDSLFYGRYNDIFMGQLILMALLCLSVHRQAKAWYKYILAAVLIYLALSFAMYCNLKGIDDFYLNGVDSVSIYICHWLGEFSVWKCTLAALAAGMLCMVCYFLKLPKRGNFYLICLLFVFLFSVTAFKRMRITIGGENDYTQQFAEIYELIDANTEKKEPVYTFAKGKFAYDLQTRLVDKMVISIDKDQEKTVAEDSYLVLSEQDYREFSHPGYVECLRAAGYVVIQRTGQ